MVESRSGRRFALFFFVAAFLVLALGRWLKPVDEAALSVAAPFVSAVDAGASAVGSAVSGLTQGYRLRDENRMLRQEVATLLRRNVMLQAEQHENQLLRRMLRYDDPNTHMNMLPADVIGIDPNSRDYVLINRGTRDGIRAGMTVLDRGGFFVGSVVDTTSNAAKVLLMLSPSSSVGAIDLSTRASGLVEGRYDGRPQLRWVTSSATVHKGDFVITSGQFNLFPRKLLLGQVVRVRHSNVALFQTADIQPAADFQNLEMVQVVRSFIPSVPSKLIGTP